VFSGRYALRDLETRDVAAKMPFKVDHGFLRLETDGGASEVVN